MLRCTFLAILALFGALSRALAPAQEPAAGESALMLCLYDGGTLWGAIEGHSAEGLAFRRLDTGGLLRLDWAHLDPVQAETLRERLGYGELASGEVMAEADRLLLTDGTELVGKIVNRTETELWLKTANSTVPVPKLRLRAAATVQVPALDVYTKEELYRQELANLEPEVPASHVALALFCERVFAFEEGLAHLARAAELDPEHQPEVLANHAARLADKLAHQEQIEVLRAVDHLRARGKFEAALAELAAFAERFPESPLGPDAERKQKLVLRSLEQALSERVAILWHDWARKLARGAAMDPEMGFEASMDWVETLSEQILARVHAELVRELSAELTPEAVRAHWEAREGVRWQKASYGEGTWLLGQSDALAGLEGEKQKEEGPKSEIDEERDRLAEKIRRYLKNQEVIRRAKSSGAGEGGDDEQDFWKSWTSNGRAGWLLAYYAEKGGDMQLREPLFRDCTECGGSGVRELIYTGSARSNSSGSNAGSASAGLIACPTCKDIGKWRTISFR